jgi:FlgD Ig-like domain
MKKIIALSLLPCYLSCAAQVQGGCEGSPGMGTLVISEIMADPVPSYGLPEKEYLEITNRTGESLVTGGIMLISGPDTAYLPSESIAPGESVILCATGSRTDFLPFGRVMPVKSFPSLNNDGEVLALRDGCGRLIHAVCYTPEFIGQGPKSGGGWSAELTDMGNPFNEPEAWGPSVDPSGGTPGRANSANTETIDLKCPRVIALWPESADTVAVLFDETVIGYGDGPWLADGKTTFQALSGDPADRKVLVPLTEEISPYEIITLLPVSSLTDFAGNIACPEELKTGIPADLMPGDILFSELLFEPAEGCEEYIEFYNNSERVCDLSRLSLSNSPGAAPTAITTVPRQLLPGEYLALTTDRMSVLNRYSCAEPAFIYEADRLPALPDDEGSLLLYDHTLNVIDRVSYAATMHLLFLSGTRGVSLEKVAPGLPSDVAGNWHSASEACDWGTPGAPPSVTFTSSEGTAGLTLSSSRVSPDGDGFEDIVSLGVFPGGEGNVISLTVFNDRGYVVRKLAVRNAAGAGTAFIWDGSDDNGARLPAGLYMIIAESFNSEGVSRRYKEVCALLYR